MNKKRIIKKVVSLTGKAKTVDGEKYIYKNYYKKVKIAKGTNSFIGKIKILYEYFKDPTSNKTKKALVGAGLLYFIIPTDIINDFIPFLGYVDDGVAIIYVWSRIEKELNEYERNKNIIDIN